MKQFLLLLALFLCACGNVGGLNLGQYPDQGASPQKFIHCHGYGCRYQILTNFTPSEWRAVTRIFNRPAKNAKAERAQIAKAIALMERYMGEAIGTKDDLPKAPLKRQSVKELDCIDETVNTTKYLGFLQDEALLKFHEVGRPVYKGFMLNGVYPHNSATVVEINTGGIYAVDSYIYANGKEPNIRPIESWLKYRVEELEGAHNLNATALDNLTR